LTSSSSSALGTSMVANGSGDGHGAASQLHPSAYSPPGGCIAMISEVPFNETPPK
jgi:hypothetical protein